jgi:hypothetical protein
MIRRTEEQNKSPSEAKAPQMRHWELRKCLSIFGRFGTPVSGLIFVGENESGWIRIDFGISSYHLRASAPTRLKMRSRGGISTLEI